MRAHTHCNACGRRNIPRRYAACVRTHGDDTGSQAPALRAWGGVLQVYARLVPIIDAELQVAAGISLTWYDLLLELNAATDRRLTMSELGERVVLSRSRVSRVVDELDAAGLVQREPHPQDRRSAYAVLTAGRSSPAALSRAALPRRHRGALRPAPQQDRTGDRRAARCGGCTRRKSTADRPAAGIDPVRPRPVPDSGHTDGSAGGRSGCSRRSWSGSGRARRSARRPARCRVPARCRTSRRSSPPPLRRS